MSRTTFVVRASTIDLIVYHYGIDLRWVIVEVNTPGLKIENFIVEGG